jgi:hypothetical protein
LVPQAAPITASATNMLSVVLNFPLHDAWASIGNGWCVPGTVRIDISLSRLSA